MKLHLYLARRYLKTLLGVTAIFFVFLVLLDLVDQLRRFDDVPLGNLFLLTMLNTPEGLYQILPLIVILAAISLFLSMARTSELVVVRAVGRSGTMAAMAPALTALVVGGLLVAMMNPIVAATSKRASDLQEVYRSGGANTISIGNEGLWLRQGDAQSQTVIRASRANAEATVLYDVSFLAYAPGRGPVRRIEAREAALGDQMWRLTDVKSWQLDQATNPERDALRFATLELPSSLTVERIRDSFGTPSAVPIWDLPGYIKQLEIAGFSARRHLVWLHMELAKPLFLVAMVLVAAGFCARHSRMGGNGTAVLWAILLGFGLYYIRNFAQILGENGQLNPVLAAWTPPVAAVMLAFGLVLQREEG